MAGENTYHDNNHTPVLAAVSSTDGKTIVLPWADPSTHRLLVSGTGGGGGNTFVYNEVVSGSGTSFILAGTPVVGSQTIYANGQRLTPTVDYSISGSTITTGSSWSAGTILADYETSGTGTFNEVVSGSGTSWTLGATPTTGTVRLYANGQRLTPTVDYSISGANITTINSWSAGTILADYS